MEMKVGFPGRNGTRIVCSLVLDPIQPGSGEVVVSTLMELFYATGLYNFS